MQVVHPYPNVMANRNTTPEIRRAPYATGLTANFQYATGDLVRLNAGLVEKLALASSIAFTGTTDTIFQTGQDYLLDPKGFEGTAVTSAFLARGVPMDVVEIADEWVFTIQSAPGVTITPANQAAIDALSISLKGSLRDLAWDNVEKVVTLSSAAAVAPRVRVSEIYAEVGDANPRAKVQFLSAFLGQ